MFGKEKIKELEAKIQIEKANNLILLQNAEELRKDIRIKEEIIESLLEDLDYLRKNAFKEANKKKPGRKKKEPTK